MADAELTESHERTRALLKWAWQRAADAVGADDAAFRARLEAVRVRPLPAPALGLTVEGVDAVTEELWRQRGRVAQLEGSMARDLGEVVELRFSALSRTEAEDLLRAREDQENAYVQELIRKQRDLKSRSKNVLFGKAFEGEPLAMDRLPSSLERAIVGGAVFKTEVRTTRTGLSSLLIWVTDRTGSLVLRVSSRPGPARELPLTAEAVPVGSGLLARGSLGPDRMTGEPILEVRDLQRLELETRRETRGGRVELHLHSRMSQLDAPLDLGQAFARAREWGMGALAITDHGVVQAFPEAERLGRSGVRAIYGLEAYVVDDERGPVEASRDRRLEDADVVVLDLETTGLAARYDQVLEIGAVRLGPKGEDTFHTMVAYDGAIPAEVTQLTGITKAMLKGAPPAGKALTDLWAFIGESAVCAHNADFDFGFLRKARGGELPCARYDTLALARALMPELKNHRLETLAHALAVPLDRHHRALDDARATAYILRGLLKKAADQMGCRTERDLEALRVSVSGLRPFGVTVLVQTQAGLRNLYELVSESHLRHFHRVPRIPLSVLREHRDGLLLGAPIATGALVDGLLDGTDRDVLLERAAFYDYVEVAAPEVVLARHRRDGVPDTNAAEELIRAMMDLADAAGKPAVAVSDAHTLDPEDRGYREVLVRSANGATAAMEGDGPYHLRTAGELLRDLGFLGTERAERAVMTDPQRIAAGIEEIRPVPEGLFAPVLETAISEVEASRDRARDLYGEPPPERITVRMEREIRAIVDNGFSSIYAIAARLVKKSVSDGYLVGSRGSVGSSLVAFLMGITEVNPLAPHYRCPGCKTVFFADELGIDAGSGVDLAPKTCACGTEMIGEGHEIPFETFLGFEGDKVPDIDLNFSGEYQSVIHRYTEEIFGQGSVFRAGTISTVAERTAYGFVKGFLRDTGRQVPSAEVDRLVIGVTGVKRTTGQHPGGLMIVPQDRNVYDFTPIQHPADDSHSDVVTTHFDYHSIEGRLLKLDLLGHDDPTMLRLLEEMTGIDVRGVPLTDPDVLELFRSTRSLGVEPGQIGSEVGTLGIPEFGTRFVRGMLRETKPEVFADLVRISGLSHGTDVWNNNAQDLVRAGTATLRTVIATREDMIQYLSRCGLTPSEAFAITERVRKGKGLRPEDTQHMKQSGVPDWYIASCDKISYLFPKAHAVAYVTSAVRIAYFKVHHPEAYYASHFSVQSSDIDADLLRRGTDAVQKKLKEIEAQGNDAAPKERSMVTWLEVAREMFARGIRVRPVDLTASCEDRFTVTPEGLLPPFLSLQGLGRSAAQAIVRERELGPFSSVENLRQRAHLSRPVIELLTEQGCLKGLPATSQLTLF